MNSPDAPRQTGSSLAAAVAATGRALLAVLRGLWRMLVLAARGAGKFVATVWRLAGALDAALWRGVKLGVATLWRALSLIAHVASKFGRMFIRWLPSRSGRAYSAFSGVILIIASLAIIDTLRVSSSEIVSAGSERRAPVDLDDPILARIEGRYVHLSEVESAARAAGALRDDERLTQEAAFSRKLVETFIEQRLLARAALDEGLHRQPQTARQLAAARERILASAYMQTRLDAIVTDAAVERLYKAQSDVTRLGDEVRARHILVETGEEAEAVMASLKAGGDFATLARELSKDRATAALGGDLNWFTRDMMTPALADVAFATPVGETAPPFQSEFGWHVLQVTDRRKTDGVPFAAVKDNIRRFLTMRAIERTLAQLKEASDVVYYDTSAQPAPSGARTLPAASPTGGALRDPEPLPPGPG